MRVNRPPGWDRLKDAQVPLLLWICAALVLHLFFGEGAGRLGAWQSDRADLRRLVGEVRHGVRGNEATRPDEPFEVELERQAPPETPPLPAQEAEKPKPPPPKPIPEEAPPKPLAVEIEKVPHLDRAWEDWTRKLAVVQEVEKNQADNPDAPRAADDANRVTEETIARTRAYDGDATDSSEGARLGPEAELGDASETRPGHQEEHREASTIPVEERPARPAMGPAVGAPTAPKENSAARRASTEPRQMPEASGEKPSSWDPQTVGEAGSAARKSVVAKLPGLGKPAAPGQPNLNVSPSDVGVEQAAREKERAVRADMRRAAHRGASTQPRFERWRAAIENYDPSVKVGNQTALNAARVPFATYLNAIHNRLHPIFADEFLSSLERLPGGHQLNEGLVTHIEIVLERAGGRIVRMGVTKSSGATAFDVVALSSVQRASPFGRAPEAIVSPDGNVYLHWEFHRDPFDACSSRNARPFLLKEPPAQVPPRRPEREHPDDEGPAGGVGRG